MRANATTATARTRWSCAKNCDTRRAFRSALTGGTSARRQAGAPCRGRRGGRCGILFEGIDVSLTEEGAGEPLVFLHGWGACKECFYYQTGVLLPLLPRDRLRLSELRQKRRRARGVGRGGVRGVHFPPAAGKGRVRGAAVRSLLRGQGRFEAACGGAGPLFQGAIDGLCGRAAAARAALQVPRARLPHRKKARCRALRSGTSARKSTKNFRPSCAKAIKRSSTRISRPALRASACPCCMCSGIRTRRPRRTWRRSCIKTRRRRGLSGWAAHTFVSANSPAAFNAAAREFFR